MKEIKQRKERRFLKTLGRVGEILVEQVLIKLGSSIIKKIGGKKTLPSILFLLASLSLFAQYPATGNKQRLGYQTTGDGLVWRGALSDTASIQPINNQSAWVILDTINLKFYTFDFTSNVWNLVGGGGSAFTQPVDSLFFNVGVPTNNVDTAKMRWDSDLATVVLGLNDNVPNELGFKNFWLVKNQTGSTIAKGSLVYANGTVGASGRITVAKFIANGSIDAKYLLGITAHDLTDGEDGYVISFGKIRQINTDTFAAGAILYPSPMVAGVWTDVEPVAPNIDMPIGFCINSSVNNGTIAIRVASGYKLNELHDLSITSPVENSSLYYSGGLWRDTTAALLVSDTASMLTPYFMDVDTVTLSNRINAKLNISDTANMLVPYLRKVDTTNMLLPYFRDADTTSLNLTSRFNTKLNLSDTASMLTNYLRTGTAASTYLPLTGGTLSGDLGISKSSNSILRLSSADVSSYGKLIFSSNNSSYLNYGASIESSGDGVGVDVGSLNFLTGYGTVRTNRMTITPTGNLTIVNNATIGGTLGVTGATTLNESLTLNRAGVPLFINSTNSNLNKISLQDNTTVRSYIGAGSTKLFTVANNSADEKFSVSNDGNTVISGSINVNSSAVFNEGSTDSDFRVESDGNANMVFVDASTDRVGIGTNAPTRTLEVNGTVGVSSNVTANSFIKSGGSFTQFLKADGTVDGNDYLTTSSAGSTYYPKTGGTISGAVTLSTTTATPTSLLGKDGSNVVGTVTTVAQTGLMTRGETTATTGTPSAIFTVTHGLGSNPSSVIITSAGIGGGNKILFEVYTKNSTTFSVQAWNLDGTEASSKEVKIYWLAIK